MTQTDKRLVVHYDVTGEGDLKEAVHAIALEQTVELPQDLLNDSWIEAHVVGRIEHCESKGPKQLRAVISYDLDTVGGETPQLLNVLFGNISLKHGIRILDVEGLEHILPGPRLGIEGLRKRVGVEKGALICTALKPMGKSAEYLASMAYQLALGGMDLIKDDHGLSNQSYAPFRTRVRLIQEAVDKANRETGQRSIYIPNVASPLGRLNADLELCQTLGIEMIMVSPFLMGLDVFRHIAQQNKFAILAHPAMSGSLFASSTHGMSPQFVLGTLFRALGADASIYPNVGGRFVFEQDVCHLINDALRNMRATFKPSFPVPAGGMTLNRVDEIHDVYGQELIHLIGGGLLRTNPDLRLAAQAFRQAVRPQ